MTFLNPDEVLNQLKLRDNMTAVDFGCGSGGWVIPLAKRLSNGRVIAIDILEESLSALGSKVQLEKIFNIRTIRADIESEDDLKLSDESCNLVLMTNLLFEVEDKKRVLEKAKRVLKSKGKILVVDWKMESSLGPEEGRVSADDVKNLAEEIGLKLKKEFSAGNYHYGLVFEKP